MGHLVGKDLYRELGKKIDGLTVRSPWNTTLYEILKALYSAEEAEIIVKMPYGLVRLDRIARTVGQGEAELQKVLEGLARKGLVVDLCIRGRYFYMVSPMVIGIFEFTMMRTDKGYDPAKIAKLFHEYIEGSDLFRAANFGAGKKVSPIRTMPWEETIDQSEHIEILDYEKARNIIEENDRFAVGLCSCRHKMSHLQEGLCDVPMEKCSNIGIIADYMIRNGLAREVSKTWMLENLAESRELGLVINADNVWKSVDFICHCCGCCCMCLRGISKYGYPNVVISSRFIARVDKELCTGCGACAGACHISVIKMNPNNVPESARKNVPVVDEKLCIGCGVCALKCGQGAMRLVERKQRVIQPENVFQRVILQCLERGTLQNQMFPEPENVTHKFMRSFIGGILKLPPVKVALMSDMLRSRFLAAVAKGAGH